MGRENTTLDKIENIKIKEEQYEAPENSQQSASTFNIFEKVCRLCGNTDCVKYDIFGEEEMGQNLPEKINKYLPGMDIANDGIPWKICDSCTDFVNAWHEFFLKSMRVKELFNNYEDDFVSDDYNPDDFLSRETDISQVFDDDDGDEFQIADNKSMVTKRRMAKKKRRGAVLVEEISLTEMDREFLNKFQQVEINGKMTYKCDLCPHAYSHLNPILRLNHFEEHYTMHTKERNFECDACGKKFRTKGYLTKHMMNAHKIGGETKKFVCEMCGKAFASKAYLMCHAESHSGMAVEHVCDLCGKSFHNKTSLATHMHRERNGKSHQCVICGKCFFTSNHMKHHMSVHMNERNYPCPQCGKLFKDYFHVKKHRREVHSSEKLFCPLCPASFSCKKYLQQHLRVKKH